MSTVDFDQNGGRKITLFVSKVVAVRSLDAEFPANECEVYLADRSVFRIKASKSDAVKKILENTPKKDD